MTLLALGINHKTASVALREKMVFSAQQLPMIQQCLMDQTTVRASVILSTCNRTELYLSVEQPDLHLDSTQQQFQQQLLNWLADFHQLTIEQLAPVLYWHYEQQAVNHLMRVACGLDSMVIGEPQILGQVKQAFSQAGEQQALTLELDRLFQHSFSVAKQIRSQTQIGQNAVSLAYMACRLAQQIFDSMSELTVLLVGAGEMIELVARHLQQHNIKQLFIANRSIDNAQALVNKVGGTAKALADLPTILAQADIVLTSTASTTPIIWQADVQQAMKQRHQRPVLMVDIAVPRDIDQQVGQLDDVYLYSLDDLQQIISENVSKRQVAAAQAEQMIAKESEKFMLWRAGRSYEQAIRTYRQQAESWRDELLNKAVSALQQGQQAETVVNQLAYQLTNRLIHAPTKALQHAAHDGDEQQLQQLLVQLGVTEP